MAQYRILYWRHIPLGVKATDVNGTVRINLPGRFQEAFQQAIAHSKTTVEATYTTSGFRWGEPQIHEGSAARVAEVITAEIEQNWDEEKARALYDQEKTQAVVNHLDLKSLEADER
ncbi:MAG: virulence factor [Chloroflexota bacterium]